MTGKITLCRQDDGSEYEMRSFVQNPGRQRRKKSLGDDFTQEQRLKLNKSKRSLKGAGRKDHHTPPASCMELHSALRQIVTGRIPSQRGSSRD
jgi:hypothetical protein